MKSSGDRTSQMLKAVGRPAPSTELKLNQNIDQEPWLAPSAVASLGRLPLMALVLGIGVGFIGVAYELTSHLLEIAVFDWIGGFSSPHTAPAAGAAEMSTVGWSESLIGAVEPSGVSSPFIWIILIAPIVGGLLLGQLYRLTKEDPGCGAGEVIQAFHRDQGKVPPSFVWKKFVGSTISIGTGASGGREGPLSLMGAGLSNWLAERFHLTVRERRILLATAVAAAVGGLFRAPLAGALLAAEILYSDAEFEPDVLIPAVLASISSYCVFCLNTHWGARFDVVAENYTFENVGELIPLAALALVIAAVGWVMCKLYYVVFYRAQRIPVQWRPVVGGAFSGAVTLAIFLSLPAVAPHLLFPIMGDGYGALRNILAGESTWWILLIIAGAKLITAVACIATGSAVGKFASSMVIGGCIGGAVGALSAVYLPGWMLPSNAHPGTVAAVFGLVGMAGYYSAVAKAPISTVIVVSELTGSYHLLLPTLWVCSLSFLLSRGFRIYKAQVANRMESPAHRGDFRVNVLEEIKVAEILRELSEFETLDESASVPHILSMESSRQSYYPVVTRAGRFVGVFSLNDLRAVLEDHEVWSLLVAADIARHNVITVHPRETLAQVSLKFAETNLEELPVVDDDDEGMLLGLISRRQLNNAYLRRMMDYDRLERQERVRITQVRRK